MKPIIAITIGDFNGVGPEVALKAASHSSIKKICQPLLVGPLDVFQHTAKTLKIKVKLEKVSPPLLKPGGMPVVDVGDGIWADVQFGKITKAAGKSAGAAIERAVQLCLRGEARALVTAPVSKEALHLAGHGFPGQTEMVAMLSSSQRVVMMLIANSMRVGLVTIHTPLRNVAEAISVEKIVEKGTIVYNTLQKDFRIKSPRIAVLGLNPHAGENGHIGDEEQHIIKPALEQLRGQNVAVDGPFPADAFFGMKKFQEYDALLAMYHDQGLIPLKMSAMGKAVNFSAGLSVIRTSPDHGTAFDIAGKGKADITSMVEAIKLALQLSKSRRS